MCATYINLIGDVYNVAVNTVSSIIERVTNAIAAKAN